MLRIVPDRPLRQDVSYHPNPSFFDSHVRQTNFDSYVARTFDASAGIVRPCSADLTYYTDSAFHLIEPTIKGNVSMNLRRFKRQDSRRLDAAAKQAATNAPDKAVPPSAAAIAAIAAETKRRRAVSAARSRRAVEDNFPFAAPPREPEEALRPGSPPRIRRADDAEQLRPSTPSFLRIREKVATRVPTPADELDRRAEELKMHSSPPLDRPLSPKCARNFIARARSAHLRREQVRTVRERRQALVEKAAPGAAYAIDQAKVNPEGLNGAPKSMRQQIQITFANSVCAVNMMRSTSRLQRQRALDPLSMPSVYQRPTLHVKYNRVGGTGWRNLAEWGQCCPPAAFTIAERKLVSGIVDQTAIQRAEAEGNSEASGDPLRSFDATRRKLGKGTSFGKVTGREARISFLR